VAFTTSIAGALAASRLCTWSLLSSGTGPFPAVWPAMRRSRRKRRATGPPRGSVRGPRLRQYYAKTPATTPIPCSPTQSAAGLCESPAVW
jgi:hypothetical protein